MLYKAVKRAFDIVFVICIVPILIIPWIIISIIIKIQSPGPILFLPKRVGKDGKVFTLYKFRTMNVNSGAIHATTLQNDPRIFPFGLFLRKSKLDETPQMINILKGEMSVIGPRPEDEVNAGQIYVGDYKEILSVRPGLSSPASLYDYTHGEKYENEDDYIAFFLPRKLDVELYYVRHRSVLYDLQTIIRTVVTIVQIMFGKKQFKQPKELCLLQHGETVKE